MISQLAIHSYSIPCWIKVYNKLSMSCVCMSVALLLIYLICIYAYHRDTNTGMLGNEICSHSLKCFAIALQELSGASTRLQRPLCRNVVKSARAYNNESPTNSATATVCKQDSPQTPRELASYILPVLREGNRDPKNNKHFLA